MTSVSPDAQRLIQQANTPGKTPEEVVDLYRKWAATYDQDLSVFRYNPPSVAASEIATLFTGREHVRILDCAAGTGLVAEELVKRGFTSIDALDVSQEMLDQAAQKGLYQKLICDSLCQNQTQIESDTYDALVAAACFCPDHLREDCFPELIRVVKPGGVIVLTIREIYLHDSPVYRDYFEQAMKRLDDEGLWKWTQRKHVENYFEDEGGVVYTFEVI